MQSDLKATFLQPMTDKQKEQGFTLIELLVVIVIVGILSAIALPSFLNQANKAKQSESKQYVGTLNRVQQSYYLEKSQFASDLTELANPVPSQTENYTYTFTTAPDNVISYGTSGKEALKSYVGMVAMSAVTASSAATMTAVLCEANTPGASAAADPTPPPTNSPNRPRCGASTTRL